MEIRFSFLYLTGVAMGCLVATAAADALPPKWQIPTICQNAKSHEECSRLEALSRNSVLNRWSKAPNADRTACLSEIDKSVKPSYWRLLDCLGDRALQSMDR
jgi:hypothetical protein